MRFLGRPLLWRALYYYYYYYYYYHCYYYYYYYYYHYCYYYYYYLLNLTGIETYRVNYGRLLHPSSERRPF